MPSIITCLIVRNEAHIIARCLDSVKPFTDYLLIHDTGSTDETINVVEAWMKANNIPGHVTSAVWTDFATNRTWLIGEARTLPFDWVLTLDADEQLQSRCCFGRDDLHEQLSADCHQITAMSGSLAYGRPLLFRNNMLFRYRGIVHESLYCDGPHVNGPVISGLTLQVGHDSARNMDGGKFLRDIEALKTALAEGRDADLRARMLFYLAQSYRDAGLPDEALETYHLRELEGGWVEELYQSIYQQGRLMESLKHPSELSIQKYLHAWEVMPARAEALHGAARLCNRTQRWQQAYALASAGFTLPQKPGLFVEEWIYDYGLMDELAISAQRTGRMAEAARLNRLLLKIMPASHHERLQKNLAFSGG